MTSIRAYLQETYQLNTHGNKALTCPKCNHTTLRLKGDELAKCFHPTCGWFVSEANLQGQSHHASRLLWAVMNLCHQALLEQGQTPDDATNKAWRYLTHRKLEPQVITESPVIGVVPDTVVLGPLLNPIRGQLEARNDNKHKDKALQFFDDLATKLDDRLHDCRGWLVFGYTDVKGQLLSLNFRKPFDKAFQNLRAYPKRKGVFNPYLFTPNEESQWPFLLCAEGEFNIFRMQSVLVANQLSYCHGVALGGSSGVDWPALKGFRTEWVLFQDHDDAGKALAEEMLLHANGRVVQSPHLNDDLDSFVDRFSTPAEALQEVQQLFGKAERRYRPFKAVEAEINGLRKHQKEDDLKNFELKQAIAGVITHELESRGVFYHTDNMAYFLDHGSKQLIPIEQGNRWLSRLIHSCGLNPEDSNHKYVFQELVKFAFDYGAMTEIYQYAHYNCETRTLYLHNRDSEVYRITAGCIEVVDNGTDTILFEPLMGYVPFDRVAVKSDKDYLLDLLLQPLDFEASEITPDEYRILFAVWVFSLFFTSLMLTKPIPACIGGKGSGKTSILRRLGMLLFGKKFQVSPMPDKPDDFDAVVTNGFLVVFDNVDGHISWLNDKLAIAATGGTIRKRVLYTTNQVQEYAIRATVAITSRTPKFTRDDVSERLLIFPLNQLRTKISEQRLVEDTLRNRNAFMSWLLLRLQEIVGMLIQTEGMPTVETELRMADFATFLIRLTHADSAEAENEARALLGKLVKAQSQFTLESDPLFLLLEVVAALHPNRPFTSKELFTELKKLSESDTIPFGYKSPISLGQKLSQLSSNINQFVGMEIITAGGNQRLYRFSPLNPGKSLDEPIF